MTERSRDLISAYLDGECSAAEAALVADRIETDAEWREEFEAVRSAREAVRGLPMVDVPIGCWDAVAAAIAASSDDDGAVAPVVALSARRARTALFATAGTAVASVAAVVALVFMVEPPASDRTVQPEVELLSSVHGARVTAVDEPVTRVAAVSVAIPDDDGAR